MAEYMDVMEKLVELIESARYCGSNTSEEIAENLIANGVTMQEWILVDDRLPDKNTTVIATTDNGIVFQCLYAYDGWDLWDGNEVNITHWQPMPQQPKVE